jgi:CRISPR-associated protein Cmr1
VSEGSASREPFHCQTITPLYGGGVRGGEVDTELPIRPSGLRGQWRFWWRLLHRDRYPSSRAMFIAERALWGGLGEQGATASRVRLRVSGVSKPTLFPAFAFKKKADGRYGAAPQPGAGVSAYALFSAQGRLSDRNQEIEEHPRSLAEAGVIFTLHLDCPSEHRAEVEEALRWWASFGGVGARTRRGLGAVRVDGLAPVTVKEVEQAGGRLVLRERANDARDAWKRAVDPLRELRQGSDVGRNPPAPDSNRPGRSRWPEADMIRRVSGRHATLHAPEHPVHGYYPRAAFGLPVVFHFKDRDDPTDHILEPDGDFDRMASPLILRPYWDGQGYRPAALLLPGWERALRQDLKLKGTPHRRLSVWPGDPATQQETAGQIKPMVGRGADPLTAFLDFFAKGGA